MEGSLEIHKMDSIEDNSEKSAEDQLESSAEHTLSTQFRENPFDLLGKDHFILDVLGEGNFAQVTEKLES
ncbi:unnamed protein product [Tetraodon nigroviridis]|uniref:(spotted green pufferfish) hypothetical protein n=1 Tax=Tetraodon nigroviridis TaxID=99883 RepID=Q4RGB4_TETNG|nr:unnamed protein product [Tetraodon nigroviridis]